MKNQLKKAGADPTVAAKNGCTALDLALLIEDTDTDAIRLIGTIHILRQQKDWVDWFKKWQFLLTINTGFMLT